MQILKQVEQIMEFALLVAKMDILPGAVHKGISRKAITMREDSNRVLPVLPINNPTISSEVEM